MPKISVIIPIYNTSRYLYRCIESVINQTLKDIEIILVDDGSTDDSKDICDDFARTYDNIKVFHKENAGPSSARNVGLDNATGEYIAFVDSDDYIALDMFEKLLKTAKEKQCDIVMCNYQIVKDGRILGLGEVRLPTNVQMSNTDIYALMENTYIGSYLWFNWNKLYSKYVIQSNHIRFNDNLIYGQDTPFNMEALFNCNGFVFINEPLYHYEQTENSQVRAKYKENYLEKLENLYDEKMIILSKYLIGSGGGIQICINIR